MSSMEKSQVVYWQLVWFFSMEAPAQEALIGSTEEQWLIEEDAQNIGANYLKGLCLVFLEGYRSDHPHAVELSATVLGISNHFDPGYWCFSSLSSTAEWRHARAVAMKLLHSETLG
jgi:hypothetical protein